MIGSSCFAYLLLKFTLNFKPHGIYLIKLSRGSYQESEFSLSCAAVCPPLSQPVAFLSPYSVPSSSKFLCSNYSFMSWLRSSHLLLKLLVLPIWVAKNKKDPTLYCFLPFQNFYSFSLPSSRGQVPTRGVTLRPIEIKGSIRKARNRPP